MVGCHSINDIRTKSLDDVAITQAAKRLYQFNRGRMYMLKSSSLHNLLNMFPRILQKAFRCNTRYIFWKYLYYINNKLSPMRHHSANYHPFESRNVNLFSSLLLDALYFQVSVTAHKMLKYFFCLSSYFINTLNKT